MPLEPNVQELLDTLRESDAPDFSVLEPAQAREVYTIMTPPPNDDVQVGSVQNLTIPGPVWEIPLRVYSPKEPGPHPILVYFHGGGWVVGDLDTHDGLCRDFAALVPCVVVAVHYRLAPEHQYPAAPQDCAAATMWAFRNAAKIGGDPGRVALAGDSAGGNLAAVVCQMLRNMNLPQPRFQLLIYPVTDNDFSRQSYADNGEGYLLTRASMEWFWNHYCPPARRNEPYASPIRAGDLANLPPAMIITAEYDPLCDEGRAYGKALEVAGVPVEVVDCAGMIHGFFHMYNVILGAIPIFQQTVEKLAKVLDVAPQEPQSQGAEAAQQGQDAQQTDQDAQQTDARQT